MKQNPVESDNTSAGDPESVLVHGMLDRFTYRNEENGFVVAQLKTQSEQKKNGSSLNSFGQPNRDNANKLTIIGTFPLSVEIGAHLLIRGRWETHPKFGKQLRALSVTESKPTSCAAIVAYLSSPSVKGIGPMLAERIVEKFGEDTLSVIDHEPERLLKVQGIKRKKLDEILSFWAEHQNQREIDLFFQNYGLSLSLARRIFAQYKERTIEMVKNNPYLLARTVRGIGFLTSDRIAMSLGLAKDSPERIEAGLRYALETGMEDGHTFLVETELASRAEKLLSVEVTSALENYLKNLASRDLIIRDRRSADGFFQDRVYLPSMFIAEKKLAKNISQRLLHGSLFLNTIPKDILQTVLDSPLTVVGRKATEHGGSEGTVTTHRLSQDQAEAIKLATSNPLMVITGGPGCGKTTVICALVNLFQRAGLTLKMAAPTGRAAQRMAEVTGAEASTIHRMLKYDPYLRDFLFNSENPLELDVLIVDESSMIDLELATSLFDALQKHVRVIIVGDADQLPSVGPGLFLWDLLGVKEVPRVRLSKLFRRAEESAITRIAYEINHSQTPNIPDSNSNIKSDAYFVDASETEDAAAKIERLMVEILPKRFGYTHDQITVLSPMNRGDLGIQSLNKRLQARLVPENSGLPKLMVGDIEFRVGDRVCHRVNNYQLGETGVFNGDQGKIVGLDIANRMLFVELWDGREIQYAGDDLTQLDLAYAITVHRSQGSEIPAVVLALHDSHTILLERQLVYTAITRAKGMLVIVGTRSALNLAARRSRSRKRNSTLGVLIEERMASEQTVSAQQTSVF